MLKLRFRHIHLDFHTSPMIPGVGAAFDRKEWQEALRLGHVDSINTFAKCHHGWSYHPTEVGQMHPQLKFNLLRAQLDAAHEIGVKVPIYMSAGVDNVASHEHPEWREVTADGRYGGWVGPVIQPGFHKMCFNSPYLDYLCEQIREVARLFPDGDGFWLDIIHQGPCCCRWCLDVMAREGLDASQEEARQRCAELALQRYYREATVACRAVNPDVPIFHNSGHITRGRRQILPFFTHLELESLPTGGWGYDHFPISAKYCAGLEYDYLGMTGKFHTTWGEFGGYKHPNALRYECAMMLACGAKCCVGDQLHPSGRMDPSTYAIIGQAYAEVEQKEPWCHDVRNVADVGLLSAAATAPGKPLHDHDADIGAGRLLMEGHFLFDVLDAEMDFRRYQALVLPDAVTVTPALQQKLAAYLAQGGKLFLTGTSGLRADGQAFLFDVGAQPGGPSEFEPDFVLPIPELQPEFCASPLVMYGKAQRLRVTDGQSLGDVYDPYFNRHFRHFCSHQHTPPRTEPSGFAAGVQKGNVLYLAHPVFTIYRQHGAVVVKDYVVKALQRLLGTGRTVESNLPSSARVALMDQPGEKRYVLHLVYGERLMRGGPNGHLLEVVEHLTPLLDTEVTLRLPRPIRRLTLEPGGRPATAVVSGGQVQLKVDRFTCHQMIALSYD